MAEVRVSAVYGRQRGGKYKSWRAKRSLCATNESRFFITLTTTTAVDDDDGGGDANLGHADPLQKLAGLLDARARFRRGSVRDFASRKVRAKVISQMAGRSTFFGGCERALVYTRLRENPLSK